MTTQTLQPVHHLSVRTLTFAGIGAALAVTAGFGVFALMTDEPAAQSGSSTGVIQNGTGDYYDGTNREVRELMHRR